MFWLYAPPEALFSLDPDLSLVVWYPPPLHWDFRLPTVEDYGGRQERKVRPATHPLPSPILPGSRRDLITFVVEVASNLKTIRDGVRCPQRIHPHVITVNQ